MDNQASAQFQSKMLSGVSRTFALTIPQLPETLRFAVGNAYLLCRAVDTIEDEPALSNDQRVQFCNQFIDVVSGTSPAQQLALDLLPRLSDSTIPAEHELIRNLSQVIEITMSFPEPIYQALLKCVQTMAYGMPLFQESEIKHGLPTEHDFDQYCYYVAGCVGEMLTTLFCEYSQEIGRHRETMHPLSVSFGQGLQMTNILKDIWDDRKRDVCWLPRDVFIQSGYDLSQLSPETNTQAFQNALSYLVSQAYHHLNNALQYTLLIPPHEKGIRRFCLWAIGMALLTLQKISGKLDFTDSQQVKISRNQVKTTVAATNLTVSSDRLLKWLFYRTGRGLDQPIWTFNKHDRPVYS
ncbi:MAG: phytoene/squalene synthase family protein [Gammaproteobacteria bacterium]|nr:phytoene/squalene synthase family protein [Gammaproteobacteria bacterium]